MLTKIKLGAVTTAFAFLVLAGSAMAGGFGHGHGHHGPPGGPWGPPGSGVPLPIAGVGLLALVAGGYVLSRRTRKADEE